jgi:hypothetical protein
MAEIGCSRTAIHRTLHGGGIDMTRGTSGKPAFAQPLVLRRVWVTEQLTIGQIADRLRLPPADHARGAPASRHRAAPATARPRRRCVGE